MLGAYVCRQCRTRLSRTTGIARNSQWQSRTIFTSLRPRPNTRPDEGKAESTVQEEQPPAQDSVQGGSTTRVTLQRQRPAVRKTTQDEPDIQYPQRTSQRVRLSRYSGLLDDSTAADSLYEDFGQEDTYQETGRTEASSDKLTYAAPIREALENGQVRGAWDLFEKTYTEKGCKALTEPTYPGELVRQEFVFSRLLGSVTGAFCVGRKSVQVTPTQVLFKYQQLGIARPEYWVRPTLARLTHEVIQALETSQQNLPLLLDELISIWRLFFQCMRSESDALEAISEDWSLPPLEEMPDVYDVRDFNIRFQRYIPKYVTRPGLGFCAVYLYSISDALEPAIQQKAAPFLRFLERLLAKSRVDTVFIHTQMSDQFKQLPVNFRQEVRARIEAAPRKAMVALGKEGEASDEMTNLEAFHMKSIARVVQTMTSVPRLDRIWEEVQETYLSGNKTTIPRSVYNGFLSGYLTLFNSQRAVEVWNHMMAHGVRPDVQSWVALLNGCAKAKDLNGFNTMWQRMVNSGIEPENYAWTTRINGLMSLRQIDKALAAMDEMGKRWLTAEYATNNTKTQGKGQKSANKSPGKAVNKCTKPSIEVVNGAISAIVQIRPESMRHEKRVAYVQKILGWATNFQIKPNAITYNSLIRLYLLAKDTLTALRLLSQMEKEGIEGDIATHTMLMSAAFENQVFDGQTEQEQLEKVLAVLNDLESSGLKLNDHVYSTAIDRLLKGYANDTAVRAVMEHMAQRNLTPSAHVYTSLVTHYFQSEPANLAEVDNIVNLLFTAPRMPSDRILYDRLVEGYALHGEVGKMMSVLTRMSKQGLLPGWGALIAVVRALVQEGDYERARDVVRDVAKGEGVARGGILGDRNMESTFRNLVSRLGLGGEGMGDFLASARQRSSGSVVHHFVEREGQDSSSLAQQQQHHVSDEGAVEEDVHGFLSKEREPELRDHQNP
ncbi:hypothetical protein COCMIDRAFT_84451 [Bipolaris oryzae ATCC 44560]|uniref:Pentacotripeptide-repeat region of PRORP domain-containing protein n=1 Tax=Bipolaris oryzae ATCC 44560 TaxID=930090 RepID=W6ZHQ5_COCMI|nr:uncharacterized protein COCMIDRAFT_84451 [Bipolaris oryzae ATCC 44560]EUC49473.1 hypothetical protein COCMIDRAFT_84451 [Bipolaris oryzae ATCC 44560]